MSYNISLKTYKKSGKLINYPYKSENLTKITAEKVVYKGVYILNDIACTCFECFITFKMKAKAAN